MSASVAGGRFTVAVTGDQKYTTMLSTSFAIGRAVDAMVSLTTDNSRHI